MQIEKFKTDIISHRQTMLRLAVKYLQNAEDAEDAVQETLLRLWQMRDRLDTISKPAAFAIQTVKNICIDHLRTAKILTTADDFLPNVNMETPYAAVERQNTLDLISKIIANLPELQRIVIRMRDVEGYELQEIAEITGSQVNAVTVNLSRARKKVREIMFKMLNYESKQDEFVA